MPRYELTEQAKEDLAEIWYYVAQDSYDYADALADELILKFKLLSKNSLAGFEREDISLGLRQFPFKNYNIFYFPIENGVEIYRILHSSRDQMQVFEFPVDEDI